LLFSARKVSVKTAPRKARKITFGADLFASPFPPPGGMG
jgi:hypothetical protein